MLESASWPFALLERVAAPIARECGVHFPLLTRSEHEGGAGLPFALLGRVATPIARECGVATHLAHSL